MAGNENPDKIFYAEACGIFSKKRIQQLVNYTKNFNIDKLKAFNSLICFLINCDTIKVYMEGIIILAHDLGQNKQLALSLLKFLKEFFVC